MRVCRRDGIWVVALWWGSKTSGTSMDLMEMRDRAIKLNKLGQ
jgi:hypothetical protein